MKRASARTIRPWRETSTIWRCCFEPRIDRSRPNSFSNALWSLSIGASAPMIRIGTIIFENLAELRAERGDWEGALVLLEQAKKAMTVARHAGAIEQREFAKAVLAQNKWNLRNFARTLYRANPENPLYLKEAFELAQWALQNEAADALSAMSARFAVRSGELAKLVRAEQDLRRDRFSAVRRLDAVEGKPHATALKTARMAIAEIDGRT